MDGAGDCMFCAPSVIHSSVNCTLNNAYYIAVMLLNL